MSEVKEGVMLLVTVEVTMVLSILKRAATRFAACERGNKVMFNNLLYFQFSCQEAYVAFSHCYTSCMQYIQYNNAARKITRLGLCACIVLYYVIGKVWGTINMSTLQHTRVQQYITNRLGSKKNISM